MPHAGPIDVQTHYLPPAMVEALGRRDEAPRLVDGAKGRLVTVGEGSAYPLLPEMVELDRKIEKMDEAGLGMSVLSVNIPGLDWFNERDIEAVTRDTNDQMAAAVAAYPDRFAAFAALPMQRPELAVTELERAMGLGLCGAMLYSNVAGRQLDEPEFRQVFEAADRLGAPLLMHPTYPLSAPTLTAHALVPVLGFLFDTSNATLRLILDGIFDRHPDLKLILGHAGSILPYILGRVDLESGRIPGGLGALDSPPSEHFKRLYVDTVSGWPPALSLVIDYLGVDRVMYATDHPFWDPDWTRDALAQLDLSEDDREAIERGNASRVLGIGARED